MDDDTFHEQLGEAVAGDEDRDRRRLEQILAGAYLDGYLNLTSRSVDGDPPEGLLDAVWTALREHTTVDRWMEADARAALASAWDAGYLRELPTPRFLDPFTTRIEGLERVVDEVLTGLDAAGEPLDDLRRAGLNRGRP
jgi:hypothetical protein